MVNEATKYKTLIKYITKQWKLEIQNKESPFYNIKTLTKFLEDNGFRKSKRQLIYKISHTILHSILKKGLCYYTTNSLAEHFKVTRKNIRNSLKNLSNCLNIAFIKIDSSYLSGNNLKDKRRFLIIPPNMVNNLCKTNKIMDLSNRRFKILNCEKTKSSFLYRIDYFNTNTNDSYLFEIKNEC